MRKKAIIVAAAAALVLSGCSATNGEEFVINDVLVPGTDSADTPIIGPETVEEEYDKNKADAVFVTAMIPHNYQGVEMNILADRNSLNEDVWMLASEQTQAFDGQTAILEKYFRDWSLPYLRPSDTVNGASWQSDRQSKESRFILVHGPDGIPHTDNYYLVDENPIYLEGYEPTNTRLLPSMASDAELVAMFNSREKEFDKLWLTAMIKHRQGAVDIAKIHLTGGVHPILIELSNQIISKGEADIQKMSALLDLLNNGD